MPTSTTCSNTVRSHLTKSTTTADAEMHYSGRVDININVNQHKTNMTVFQKPHIPLQWNDVNQFSQSQNLNSFEFRRSHVSQISWNIFK